MPEKFTVKQKEQIVIESFTATNIAELCRRHGVCVAQFHRWKERFLEGVRKGLGESSRGNEYQKEIDDLKRLVGDQALAIDALKKVDQGGKDDCCEYSQERNAGCKDIQGNGYTQIIHLLQKDR
jgi:transposase